MAMKQKIQDTTLDDPNFSSEVTSSNRPNSSIVLPIAIVTVGGLGLYAIYRDKKKSKLESSSDSQSSSDREDTVNKGGGQDTSGSTSDKSHIEDTTVEGVTSDINPDDRTNNNMNRPIIEEGENESGHNSPSSQPSESDISDQSTTRIPSDVLGSILLSKNSLLNLSTLDMSGDINTKVNYVNRLYNSYFSDMVDDISSIDDLTRLNAFIQNAPKHELLVQVVDLDDRDLSFKFDLDCSIVYGLFTSTNNPLLPKSLPIQQSNTRYSFTKDTYTTSINSSKDMTASNGILNITKNSVVRVTGSELSLYLILKPSEVKEITVRDQTLRLIPGVNNFVLLKGKDALGRSDINDLCELVDGYRSALTKCSENLSSIIEEVLQHNYNFDNVTHIFPGSEEALTIDTGVNMTFYNLLKNEVMKSGASYEKNGSPASGRYYTSAVFDRLCRDCQHVYCNSTLSNVEFLLEARTWSDSQASTRAYPVTIILTNTSGEENFLACARNVGQIYSIYYENHDYRWQLYINGFLGVTKQNCTQISHNQYSFSSTTTLSDVNMDDEGLITFSGESFVNSVECNVMKHGGQGIPDNSNFFIAVRLHKGDSISWHTHDGKYRTYKAGKLEDLIFPVYSDFFSAMIRDHNITVDSKLSQQ